jgi:hypothetical protein
MLTSPALWCSNWGSYRHTRISGSVVGPYSALCLARCSCPLPSYAGAARALILLAPGREGQRCNLSNLRAVVQQADIVRLRPRGHCRDAAQQGAGGGASEDRHHRLNDSTTVRQPLTGARKNLGAHGEHVGGRCKKGKWREASTARVSDGRS